MSKHSDAFLGSVLAVIAIFIILLMIIEWLVIGNFSIVGFVFMAIVFTLAIKMTLEDL